MKKSNLILFLLFLLTGCLYYIFTDSPQTTGNSVKIIESKIIRVIDGDTLEIENGERVRMLGVNTPEKKKFMANEAINFTKQLENQTVKIETKEKDKYGRNLGYVFYNDELFNQKLLENGFAHAYYYGEDSYKERMYKTEEIARQNQKGIWKHSKNYGCLLIQEFSYLDVEETDQEKLILRNICNVSLSILIKDDATHMYEETISANSNYEKTTQNVWNDAGDTLFVWDNSGILIFERYP